MNIRLDECARLGTLHNGKPINTYNVYDTAAPFGGYKQSGFGREMGMHALSHYTQTKTVWVDLNP